MADKPQNTSDASTNATGKAGLVTDLNDSLVTNEQYSHARNAVRNSKDGDLGSIGNEPSNILCFEAPYKIIGTINLSNDDIIIFSTNNVKSEIGIGNSSTCIYTKIYGDDCLNFNDQFPITGESKKDFQKGTIIYFTDKRNPPRRIELKNIGKIDSCDDILVFRKIDYPCISLERGQSGNIPNGMYSVALAYVVNGQVFTDWYGITNRIALYSTTNSNSLEVTISNLDKEFDQFALVVVGTYVDPSTNGVTKLAKQIGTYSTSIRTVSVTDFINSTYKDISLSTLVIQKPTWVKAGIISSNSNYLFLADLVSRPEENYQLKAMSIETEYVVDQISSDYYENDGKDIGYYRDENYDFYIQGVYNTGELTEKFHIPGRIATSDDKAPVSSPDVYELDKQFADCEIKDAIPRWRVENTAEKMIPQQNEFFCGRRVIGTGKMGYFESTDRYPDNTAKHGRDANTQIRYHKMPDECKVPRYTKIDGKTYINILGVRFKNIAKFDNEDIIGYKITRSDRKGGNGTVVARGLMTNVRSYHDSAFDETVYYSNYPVNDLGPDQYLSSTQTVYKNNKETNFTPLTDYHKDRFTFYSPHTSFEPKYSLGPEVKIECEEIADVTGKFDIVYNHPQAKLLNQFAFWVALAIGIIETYFEASGLKNQVKTDTQGAAKGSASVALNGSLAGIAGGDITILPAGSAITFGPNVNNPKGVTEVSSSTSRGGGSALSITGQGVVDSIQGIISAIGSGNASSLVTYLKVIKSVLALLVSMGLTAALTAVSIIRYADEVLNTIYNFMGFTDYVYQYNASAVFNQSICVTEGNKRRRLLKNPLYIPSTVVSIEGDVYNNLNRETSVYLQLNKEIADPKTKDTSRNTATGFKICDDITKKARSVGSAFYVTNKEINPNQYGQLGSSAAVSMHSCALPFDGEFSGTSTLYGGDCVITRFQFQKRMQFFSQNMANTNFRPGTEYDYRKYRNIAYPRFWMDTTKFDFGELLSSKTINYAKFNRTTSSKYNLDCIGGDKKNIARVDDAYMYLSNNAGLDFFVEADYNVDFREKQTNEFPYYSRNNRNVSDIFRADRLGQPEEFVISRAFSDLYTTEIFAPIQREDFDPLDPLPTDQTNSVIYSLPAFNLQQVDNWQHFLPANYFAFRESDFGDLTGIHKLDQDRIVFLFSKASPFISMGRDFLELENSGRKVTLGDGGIFAQDPREMMPTDNNYAACNSRYAFSNTHLGKYYPSERQGRIINVDGLDDITKKGISYWCKNYMPISLYKYFPTYPQIENPVAGVGYLTAFDSFNETVYITKRDFSPKKEIVKDIKWNGTTFTYKGNAIALRDSRYFNDISWTLSYSPLDEGFISWHDWHPDWVVQRDNHFMTVKGNKVYKHNEAYDSYCNFYGIDYPFEIEFISNSGQQIEIARSMEYLLEVYRYKNFGRDRFHVHHENFSHLIVHNTEQISPLLALNYSTGNPEQDIMYPIRNTLNEVMYDILFSKEENKYRVNQFWDTVKDRGEFSSAENHLFPTDESGYKQVINPVAIDINKPEEQRKKFRHYWTKFRLIKAISGKNKFITKLYNIKKLISIK